MIEYCIGLASGLGASLLLHLIFRRPKVQTKCADAYCGSRLDPRCAAQNCTKHCAIYCRCIEVWKKSDQALQLAQQSMAKAKR